LIERQHRYNFPEMDLSEKGVALQTEIEARLPDFVAMVRNSSNEIVILHQDAFAADYQANEFDLLGKAIKYAGMFGRTVQIVGRNRETLTSPIPSP